MSYIDANCGVDDRRRIVIGGEKRYREPDWFDSKLIGNRRWWGLIPWWINKEFRRPVCPEELKVMQYEIAKNTFDFPPNHPVKDTAYATCDVVPNHYVPISTFHDYFQEQKYSSFLKLCANLGAKEILYEAVDYDSQELDLSGPIPTDLEKFGIKFNQEKNIERRIAASFSEGNKSIKPYESPWINTEPTWKAMIDMRKENDLEAFRCDYTYTDDFGINGDLIKNFENFRINIGGSFKHMKKITISYNVIFWHK